MGEAAYIRLISLKTSDSLFTADLPSTSPLAQNRDRDWGKPVRLESIRSRRSPRKTNLAPRIVRRYDSSRHAWSLRPKLLAPCRLRWYNTVIMRVKDRLLSYFERHTDEHVSGERLAALLGVSRAAVWKAIQELKSEGYVFSAVTNKGYRLEQGPDILSLSGIASYVPEDFASLIHFHEELESTNKTAKLLAMDGAPHGTAVAAVRQTGGRGRRGRSFASPEGGVYLSIVLRPSVLAMSLNGALLVTSATAVAISQAISEVCGIEVSIKWVNDLYYRGKKVCGILSEGVADLESGGLDCIVVGAGVNFSTPVEDFPEEIRSIAGSLYDNRMQIPSGVSRNRLAALMLRKILSVCVDLEQRHFLDEYRRRSFLIGQQVMVLAGEVPLPAIVLSIDDDCHLVVQYENGMVEHIGTGDVSIRFSQAVKDLT